MAVLKLTLYNVSCYEQKKSTSNSTVTYSDKTDNPSLSSEKNKEVSLYLNCKDSDTNKELHDYNLSLVEYKFQKKMYQPTEILAYLQIINASGKTWYSIGRKRIESTFKHKQVKLAVDDDSIGDDFYVHAVLPCYKKDSMVVKLKIYSLDKLLTLDKTCYSYVGKKLVEGILNQKLKDYRKPYKINGNTNNFPECNNQMKVLKYDRWMVLHDQGQSSTYYVEHIFPYLVQYNESFYDMLIRTCNRWGEFVFWENGKLNIGYNSEKTEQETDENGNKNYVYKTIPGDFKTITFPNIDTTNEIARNNSQFYFPVGADDDTIRDTKAKKSKWEVKGKILSSINWDIYGFQWVNQLLATDKDFVSFVAGKVVDDLLDYLIESNAVSNKNDDYNAEYFPESKKVTNEKYNSSYNAMNEFTEIDTGFNDAKYKEILQYEQKAMENVMEIDYDTTWPGLKLGEIIEKDGETFIVVEVDCEKNSAGSPVFRILAIGSFKFTDENNNTTIKFYPAMLPTGHVRYSGPQKATVKVASSEDPCDQNRVRVAYPWQMTGNDSWIGDLSPRIRIASSDGGANMASRFYEGDSVMIGYIDGNIERPYVLGSIPKIGTVMNNVHTMTTPGGHALNLTDGTGQGFKFIANAFMPVFNTIASFDPTLDMDLFNTSIDDYFEGGFSLTDRYGIYSISGSTEKRSVEIKSPWGNVMINAFTGITIKAPNGDINIEGKNVKISAGNNLTLASGTNIEKKFDQHHQTVFSTGTNIATAVAEKIAQRLVKVIDLKMVRSAVDIFMRPVEGTLELSSMRFMKLKAGMENKCEFPAIAYNTSKKNDLLNSLHAKFDNQYSPIVDTDRVFQAIKGFVEYLADNYKNRSESMVAAKTAFNNQIAALKEIANNEGNPVCKTYDELKTDFWEKAEYAVWVEAKLDFKDDNVGIASGEDDDCKSKVNERFYNTITGEDAEERIKTRCKQICKDRKRLREEILKKANDLRKLICEMLNFDMKKAVDAYFVGERAIAGETEAIKEANKNKLKNAVQNDKIGESALLKYPDASQDLNASVAISDIEKAYLRRIIIFNLLKEFGFDKDVRRKIKKDFNDTTVTEIPDPNLTSKNPSDDNSLVNDDYWRYFVTSLSGIPAVNKAVEAAKTKPGAKDVGIAAGKVVLKTSGVEDLAYLINDICERNIWGNGQEGRILIGADGQTYEFKNKNFYGIQPFDPEHMMFSEDCADLKDDDQKKLIVFMSKLRKVLFAQ